MASYLQSSELIESVQRRANIPSSQVTFTDEDFLGFANEEIQNTIVPLILAMHEEYLVYTATTPLVQGQLAYAIPPRAIGSKLRSLRLSVGGQLHPMARIQPENRGYALDNQYYLQNTNIMLPPTSVLQGTLVMDYFLRPNQLVMDSHIGIVTAIDAGTITVTGTPDFALVPLDILEATGGHRLKGMDITPLTFAPNSVQNITTLTFNPTDLPADIAIGDHLALAGQCMIPQIPDEMHSLIAQRVACRCLESLGDQTGLELANAKLKEIEGRITNLIDNRVESSPKKILNPNGLLRNGRSRRF
jgi:hypothetical protein